MLAMMEKRNTEQKAAIRDCPDPDRFCHAQVSEGLRAYWELDSISL
jgi:hypothetical protein